MGYSEMALSASYSGPLMNILLTIGVGGLMNIGKDAIPVELSFSLILMFIGVYVTLFVQLVVVSLNSFKIKSWFGYVLQLLYFGFIIGACTFVAVYS
jgi:Ca2+/Na+ antiporter